MTVEEAARKTEEYIAGIVPDPNESAQTVWIAERAFPYEGSDLLCVATTSDVAKAHVLNEIRRDNQRHRELYGPDFPLDSEPEWVGDDERGWHWDSDGDPVYTITRSEVIS